MCDLVGMSVEQYLAWGKAVGGRGVNGLGYVMWCTPTFLSSPARIHTPTAPQLHISTDLMECVVLHVYACVGCLGFLIG
jgi:hypothetical protein